MDTPWTAARNGASMRGVQDNLASRLLWIFGSPRSGSTWLAQCCAQLSGGLMINEPLIGAHLGLSVGNLLGVPVEGDPLLYRHMATRASYFFADDARAVWEPPLRALLLSRFATIVGERSDVVIVKEPWGSVGAPLLMRLLPESRIIFLLRDGRDVVDSLMAGADEGWITDAIGTHVNDRTSTVSDGALMWVRSVEATKEAFDSHSPKLRHQLTYEGLLADTSAELKLIAAWLGLGQSNIEPIVERTKFSSRAVDTVGSKHFFRAASPGRWRENLTPDEQEIVALIMGPTLAKFGYE